MTKYLVSTSTQHLAENAAIVMVRDEITEQIAKVLKEEVPNLCIVHNSSELSEFIDENLPSEVFVVTDVTYKFMRDITEPDKNISWVYCEVFSD